MSKLKKLESIYARIPGIECKGLCHPSCTIVPVSKIEAKRAKSRLGGKNPFNSELISRDVLSDISKIPTCGALKDKRCTIYTARPAMCRLFGVAEGLECPFGCVPKGTISRAETLKLIQEIEDL
jgi:Fe-S-cluster containining protein